MSALDVRLRKRAGRGLALRVLVADRTITITVAGALTACSIPRLTAELAEAFELCSGVVVVDVTACAPDGDVVVAAVKDAVVRAPGARCRVQVATADRAVAAVLDAAGISRTVPR